jgi:hypothetical protein
MKLRFATHAALAALLIAPLLIAPAAGFAQGTGTSTGTATAPATTTAAPPATSTPPATATAPAAPAARATTPARPAATAPAARTTAAPAALPAGQFKTEAEAKAHCPADTVVWVNKESKIYHLSGERYYGKTKSGAYMCQKEAGPAGFRAPRGHTQPAARTSAPAAAPPAQR